MKYLWYHIRPYVYGDLAMLSWTTRRIKTTEDPVGYEEVVPGPVGRVRRKIL